MAFVIVATGVGYYLWTLTRDMPDYAALKNYEPPVMTRTYASDGQLLAEYASERRLYIPIQAVPQLLINAFLSAEDKNFYSHPGVDVMGLARAAKVFAENEFMGGNKRLQGGSTITQQVAKNFLLTNERSIERKAKEAILSFRIESTYSKDRILELYLNEINLGFRSYGIAAAALNYFDKSVHELELHEAAYLAALPKAPENYNPYRNREAALTRRDWVDRPDGRERLSRRWRRARSPRRRTSASTRARSARVSRRRSISLRKSAARSVTFMARRLSTRAA